MHAGIENYGKFPFFWYLICLLQVFSVTPFKIDQNKNQNRSIDKVQNLGNERRYIYILWIYYLMIAQYSTVLDRQFSGVPCMFYYSFITYLSLYKVTILFPGIFIMWREFFPGQIIFIQQSSCFEWYVCNFVHSFFQIVMCPFFGFISLLLRSIAN